MVKPSSSARYSAELLERGYCIIDNLVSADLIGALASDFDDHFARTGFSEGAFSGEGTRRFAGLLKRSPHAARLVEHELILRIAQDVLGPWCDHFSLNLTQAIELAPGSQAQVPHRDQDMWPCSRFVSPERGVEFLVNVMWPLTPFTPDNGATLIWPGSHRRQEELLIDPGEAVVAQMAPGSALMFPGSTLHAAGGNRTPLPRRGMIVSYAGLDFAGLDFCDASGLVRSASASFAGTGSTSSSSMAGASNRSTAMPPSPARNPRGPLWTQIDDGDQPTPRRPLVRLDRRSNIRRCHPGSPRSQRPPA